MKKPVLIYKIVLFLLTALLSFQIIFAQEKEIKELIQTKEFVFKAQTVIPGTGGSQIVNADYDLQLISDSIAVYLPYFGRAYTATYNSAEGGVRLNTSAFDYRVKERRKGGWLITILPKDSDIREMYLTVSANGSATLNVTSNTRQAISYHGRMIKRSTN